MASTLSIFCRHFCCRSAIRQPLSPHHPTATATAATWRTKLPNHTVPPAAIQLTRQQLRLHHLLLQSRAMSQTALYPAAFTRKAAECSAASSEISISNFACKEAARSLPQAKTHNHIARIFLACALCIRLAITPFVRYRYFELTGSMSEDHILKVTPPVRCAAVYWLLLFAVLLLLVAAVCWYWCIGCCCMLVLVYWLLLFAAPQCIG
jgi:hypothetical protein